MVRVCNLTPELLHYRVPFHDAVWRQLKADGVDYRVTFPAKRTDGIRPEDFDWAEPTSHRSLGKLMWQRPGADYRDCDLVIIAQHNAILSNYPIQLSRLWRRNRKTAFFGHGMNFQAHHPRGAAERFKRLWIDKVDWWFAYTERSADVVASSGFPRDRITVFDNAIDTTSIAEELRTIDHAARERAAQALVQDSRNVGIHIGRLYDIKRIAFLIESAKRVRTLVPDFHLIVIGSGPDEQLVTSAAASHTWIHPVGPKYGAERTLLADLGCVFLFPGAVGLSVLDSFAYGTPMVTTENCPHGPEYDYIENGRNGIIVPGAGTVETYSDAVVKILRDDVLRQRLKEGATEALAHYTIENMSRRFADGVIKALAA